ncbi:MAG: hypothetical protein SU899_05630 [Chloroflexota bacterium]|nr:hypothetical protein [Chloroflexota bacterium]
MELSPLAKERLARIGEPSQEEKDELRHAQELSSLLSPYFTGKLSAESLWTKLKEYKDEGKEFVIREAQLNLAGAISLGSNELDFNRCREGILAVETLKDDSKYSILEANLNSIQSLYKQYNQEREQAFDAIRSNIERQLEAVAQQVTQKTGGQVDVKSSAELNVTSSPQWREFISKHENEYQTRFQSYLVKLRDNL